MPATQSSSPVITQKIANELNVKPPQVSAAIALLDEGSTVPFISRYRKEATGGLDDLQLRDLELRLRYLREMDERVEAIITSISEQDKLTPELEKQIRCAETKTILEDLYLPYKPKRRTKAMIAIEAGLEPLADELFADPNLDPETQALNYIDNDSRKNDIEDVKAALEGARDILMERFSEDAALMGRLRNHLWDNGEIRASVVEKNKADAAKFSDYFDYSERLKKIPSHRALAVFRGRKEGFLSVEIGSAGVESGVTDPCEGMIAAHFGIANKNRTADTWLGGVVTWTWRIKLIYRLETDLLGQLREQSDDEAIRVFTENMKAILLAPPAGNKVTLGLDPGLRTGVKVCVVDRTGKFLEDTAIYPHQPRNQWDESISVLAKLAKKHGISVL